MLIFMYINIDKNDCISFKQIILTCCVGQASNNKHLLSGAI